MTGCGTNRVLPEPAPATAKSGYHYQSIAEQQLQDDEFANPGYLWVDEGKALFETRHTIANTSACSSCHQSETATTKNQWQSAATRYPTFDATLMRVISLEQRINQCRVRNQKQTAYAWESRELLALTAYVASRAQRQPIAPARHPKDQQSSKRGEAYYRQRKGQLNLACKHCHEQNPGKMLRGDRLSEGLPTGYPAYKLEWQALGSLQRRLRDCDIGVRATPQTYGSQIYVDVERYLKDRAAGLAIETPAVRR